MPVWPSCYRHPVHPEPDADCVDCRPEQNVARRTATPHLSVGNLRRSAKRRTTQGLRQMRRVVFAPVLLLTAQQVWLEKACWRRPPWAWAGQYRYVTRDALTAMPGYAHRCA